MSLLTASPVVALAGTIMSLGILGTDRKSVDFPSAWRLIAAAFLGIPLGVLLLCFAPERAVKFILGLVLVLYGIFHFLTPRAPRLPHENYAFPFGFIAGILGGAYSTSGPPLVIYGTLRHWSPASFRATLQYCFLASSLATLAGHGLAGLWTPLVIKLFLWALPGIGLGIYLGGKAHRAIPQQAFSRIVVGVLMVIGIFFLLSGE